MMKTSIMCNKNRGNISKDTWRKLMLKVKKIDCIYQNN